MLIYKAIKKRREENQPSSEPAVHSEKHNEKKLCSHRLGSQSQTSTSPLLSNTSKQTYIHPEAGPLEPQQAEASLELADLNQRSQIQASGPCELCKKEKHNARVYRWKLIAGLLLPYFLASVDLTIVAAALPFIASHFSMTPFSFTGFSEASSNLI